MLDMPSMTINPFLHPEISYRAIKAGKERWQDRKTWIQTARRDLNPTPRQG
jgi:hypothetical protein